MPRYSISAAAIILLLPVMSRAALPPTPSAAQVDFGHKFADAIAARDHDAAVAMFDGPGLMASVQANIAAPAKVKQDFSAAANSFSNAIVKALIAGADKGNSFKFIRCRQRGNEWVAMYRKRGTDASTDYIEFCMKADATGHLHFVDTYDLAQGTRSSETLRRIYLDAVIKEDKTVNIGAKEREMMDNYDRVQDMTEDVTKGKYQAALDLYKTLPDSVQHDKRTLYWHVMALDQLGDAAAAEYTAAIADCRKFYPTDPSLDFLALDHLIQQKQFKAAHESLDRLMAYTGEDGNWHFMQGNVYNLSGQKTDRPLAVREFKKAISIEPDFDPPYWNLISIDLEDKQFADVASTLTAFKHNTGRGVADLTTISDYADFVKSPEGKAWIAEQKQAAPTTEP